MSNVYPRVKRVDQAGPTNSSHCAVRWDPPHHGSFGEPSSGQGLPRTAAPVPGPAGLCRADPTPGRATDQPRLLQGLVGSEPQPPFAGHAARQLPEVRGSRPPRRLCPGEGERLGCAVRGPQGEWEAPRTLGSRWPDPPENNRLRGAGGRQRVRGSRAVLNARPRSFSKDFPPAGPAVESRGETTRLTATAFPGAHPRV